MDPPRFRGIPKEVYCSLDRIDLAAEVDGRLAAIQTDHRSRAEIEAEPELSALYAMARVLNARGHMIEDGHPDAAVHYVVAGDPPPLLRDALIAAGATLERMAEGEPAGPRPVEQLGPASEDAVSALADRSMGALARRAAARVGSRDLAMALRMLEDQTFADPPGRDDEPRYWARVLELAALVGELLRAKYPQAGRWIQTDRALVPFGFQLTSSGPGGATVMFPTNRAQRVIEDGADESLFKLLLAAEETLQRPADGETGRLMPSLRDRRSVEIDEVVWQTLLAEGAPADLPIVVCGIDGENTFGMIRREAISHYVRDPHPAVSDDTTDEAMDEALANLAAEEVETEELHAGELVILVVSGSFYAAEKILDRAFMLALHDRLDAEILAAAVPTRGLLMVTAAHTEASHLARFAAFAELRFDEGGGRAISPTVMLVSEGRVAGFVHDGTSDRAETAPIRAETASDRPRSEGEDRTPEDKPGFLRRLLGRK